MERELQDLAFVSVALITIVGAIFIFVVAGCAGFIDKLNIPVQVKKTKIFLVICYSIFIFSWIFPALQKASPYVLADYNVSCSKPQDSCVVKLKKLPIKVIEFKLSEIKSILSYTYYHEYLIPRGRYSVGSSRKETHYVEGIFLSKGGRNNRYLVTGLIANSSRDENFKKFKQFLKDDTQELKYVNNNQFEEYMWYRYLMLFFFPILFVIKGKLWEWKNNEDVELAFRKKHYFIIMAVIIYSVYAFLRTLL